MRGGTRTKAATLASTARTEANHHRRCGLCRTSATSRGRRHAPAYGGSAVPRSHASALRGGMAPGWSTGPRRPAPRPVAWALMLFTHPHIASCTWPVGRCGSRRPRGPPIRVTRFRAAEWWAPATPVTIRRMVPWGRGMQRESHTKALVAQVSPAVGEGSDGYGAPAQGRPVPVGWCPSTT